MPFKCFACGLTFDSVEDFMQHKLAHKGQAERPEKRGLACMSCRKSIPVDSTLANYVGDIGCPSCGQRMRVRIEDGEVLFVATKQD